jgi:hypothetical protein
MKPIGKFFRIALFTGVLAGAVLTAQVRLAPPQGPAHCINYNTVYMGPPTQHAILTGPHYIEGCRPAK